LTTLQEYLVDYASPETRATGEKVIAADWKIAPGPPARLRKTALIREKGATIFTSKESARPFAAMRSPNRKIRGAI
jgi:hypothetical protein